MWPTLSLRRSYCSKFFLHCIFSFVKPLLSAQKSLLFSPTWVPFSFLTSRSAQGNWNRLMLLGLLFNVCSIVGKSSKRSLDSDKTQYSTLRIRLYERIFLRLKPSSRLHSAQSSSFWIEIFYSPPRSAWENGAEIYSDRYSHNKLLKDKKEKVKRSIKITEKKLFVIKKNFLERILRLASPL